MIYSSKKLHLNKALRLHKPIDVREKMCIWVGWRVQNVKKGLGFGQKNHYWVNSCIQSIVLGVSRRKNPKIFFCGAFYSYVFNEMFIEVP